MEVTVNDNDAAGVTVTPTSLTLTEEDSTGGAYTVVLTTQPSDAVTVEVMGAAGMALTVNPTSLTFTTETWGTAQTVTVTAGADANTGNETVTLSHAATGGGYDNVEIADVTVTVTDNDEPGHRP